MTLDWYSEYTYFDRSDESELAVLPQKYDRSPTFVIANNMALTEKKFGPKKITVRVYSSVILCLPCSPLKHCPANMRRWTNVGLLLAVSQRWANVSCLLGEVLDMVQA